MPVTRAMTTGAPAPEEDGEGLERVEWGGTGDILVVRTTQVTDYDD